MKSMLFGIFCLLTLLSVKSFRGGIMTRFSKSSQVPFSATVLHSSRIKIPGFGGRIIVTGIGSVDDDEFALTLLNEQNVWKSVVLATGDSEEAQKRFLSRTARYSGLLNVLEFVTTDLSSGEQLAPLLQGANAWIAYNVSQAAIPLFTDAALEAGIKRAIFTLEIPADKLNETNIMELDAAAERFEKAGGAFTGIRHGRIIPGDEYQPYEILNSTLPLVQETVEKGVLTRVASEMLKIDKSVNQVCGLSSSSAFAAAYLDVLRSSGLTRSQEVTKMYSGGLQRVAKLTVDEYEARKKRDQETREKKEQAKLDEAEETRRDREKAKANKALPGAGGSGSGIVRVQVDPNASVTPWMDEEPEFNIEPTDEENVQKRADEILKNVWIEMDTRMYAKSTSKGEFLDKNREMALALARKEYDEELALKKDQQEDEGARQEVINRLVDVNRKQYQKLLALERKEMQHQKEISDTWVKYIYLLLESTLAYCKETGKLFHNLDEYSQTLLLRQQANELRKQCSLAPFEVVYDPLDAKVIVDKLSGKGLGAAIGLERSGDDVSKDLEEKHGNTLKTVAALRGASQIIELAIQTLKKDLPPPPPSVNELRRKESSSKQEAVSASRLEGIRSRGKPKGEQDSGVGKL